MTSDITLDKGVLIAGARSGVKVVVSSAPVPKLLRVSRQFKDEYEKQIKRMQVLTFTGLGGTVGEPTVGADMSMFKRVEMDLLVMCTPGGCLHSGYDGAEEISFHTNWMGP